MWSGSSDLISCIATNDGIFHNEQNEVQSSLNIPRYSWKMCVLWKPGYLISRALPSQGFAVSISVASVNIVLPSPESKLVPRKGLGAAFLWCEHLERCLGARGLRGSPRRLGSDPREGASFGLSREVEDSQEGREARESKMVSAWLFGKLERRRGWRERFVF